MGSHMWRLLCVVALASAVAVAEEGEKGEAEEGGEKPTESGMAVSVMLIGAIVVMMSLFYFVNWPDPDMREYSWKVVSSTISIFSAVLVFSGVNGVVEYYVSEGMAEPGRIMVGFAHMFFWWLVLQYSLAAITGAIGHPCARRKGPESFHAEVEKIEEEARVKAATALRDAHPHGGFDEGSAIHALLEEIEHYHDEAIALGRPLPDAGHFVDQAMALLKVEKLKLETAVEKMDIQLKCFSVLLGHITGFATIFAWGEVQQCFGKHNLIVAYAIVPISYVCMLALNKVTDVIREHIAHADDGEKDEAEELWDDATEETEDDVSGLACSFLASQAIRFHISSHLPNVEGEDREGFVHSSFDAATLLVVATALLMYSFFRTLYIKRSIPRVTPQVRIIITMIFAWCVYFSMDWMVGANSGELNPMLKQVIIALIVTGIAFLFIYLADKLADQDWTSEQVDDALRESVEAWALLIGFGWEKSFDLALVEFTRYVSFRPECITRLVMGFMLCILVIPAWRIHILPSIIDLESEEKKKEAEEEEKHAGTADRDLEEPLLVHDAAGTHKSQSGEESPSAKKGSLLQLGGMDADALKAEIRKLQDLLAEAEKDVLHHTDKENEHTERGYALEETVGALCLEMKKMQLLVDKITTA